MQVSQLVHCADLMVRHCQHMLTRVDRLSVLPLQAPPSSYIGTMCSDCVLNIDDFVT